MLVKFVAKVLYKALDKGVLLPTVNLGKQSLQASQHERKYDSSINVGADVPEHLGHRRRTR